MGSYFRFLSLFKLSPEVDTLFSQWISGAGDPRCTFHLVMGVSDPWNVDPYKRQSIVLVPTDASGLTVVRPMSVMGYDDAPEGEFSHFGPADARN